MTWRKTKPPPPTLWTEPSLPSRLHWVKQWEPQEHSLTTSFHVIHMSKATADIHMMGIRSGSSCRTWFLPPFSVLSLSSPHSKGCSFGRAQQHTSRRDGRRNPIRWLCWKSCWRAKATCLRCNTTAVVPAPKGNIKWVFSISINAGVTFLSCFKYKAGKSYSFQLLGANSSAQTCHPTVLTVTSAAVTIPGQNNWTEAVPIINCERWGALFLA